MNILMYLRLREFIFFLIIISCHFAFFSDVLAQEETQNSSSATGEENVSDPCENSEQNERVPTGTIASVGSFGRRAAIDVDLGDEVPGGQSATILASISTVRSNACRATIKNVSECNAYTLGLKIVEGDMSGSGEGRNLMSDTVTFAIGSKKEFNFACNNKKNYQVTITSSKVSKRN